MAVRAPIPKASSMKQNGMILGRLNQQISPVRSSINTRTVASSIASVADASTTLNSEVATLPETPKTPFTIPPEDLIKLAKQAFDTNTGIDDDSVLSADFRFEFPIVSLDRAAYLKAVRGFQLKSAIPDLQPNAYDWRVDAYEPNRVWFTIRTTGTHTGSLYFGNNEYKATGNAIRGAPECCSYVFDEEGKVKTFTGGVVMDRRVGNTNGMGALFGILSAIGVKVPKPGSIGFAIAVAVNNFVTWIRSFFSFLKKDE